MPKFSSLAGLEVAHKFVVVGWWGWVGWVGSGSTVSNLNQSCSDLSGVELGFDNYVYPQYVLEINNKSQNFYKNNALKG